MAVEGDLPSQEEDEEGDEEDEEGERELVLSSTKSRIISRSHNPSLARNFCELMLFVNDWASTHDDFDEEVVHRCPFNALFTMNVMSLLSMSISFVLIELLTHS